MLPSLYDPGRPTGRARATLRCAGAALVLALNLGPAPTFDQAPCTASGGRHADSASGLALAGPASDPAPTSAARSATAPASGRHAAPVPGQTSATTPAPPSGPASSTAPTPASRSAGEG